MIDVTNMTKKELLKYSKNDQEVLLKAIQEISLTGQSPTLNDLWYSDYDEIPVDIDTFLDNPDYLGEAGASVYPQWREELRNIFDDGRDNVVNEAIFTGAIGLGKSQIAVTGIAYILYKLLCLKNPQEYYGLSPASKIAIVLINISLQQSNIVAYSKLQGLLVSSPWFRRNGTIYEKGDEEVFLPAKGIYIIIGSKSSHIIGTDVFCLTGDTKVETAEGFKTMKEMYESGEYFTFKQFDIASQTFVDSLPAKSHLTKMVDQIIELEMDDGSIIHCTDNELFLVRKGNEYMYKEAKDLTEEDEIVNRKEELVK